MGCWFCALPWVSPWKRPRKRLREPMSSWRHRLSLTRGQGLRHLLGPAVGTVAHPGADDVAHRRVHPWRCIKPFPNPSSFNRGL